MWVSRWWTRWQEGLPAPLPVWGDTSACSTGGPMGSGNWGLGGGLPIPQMLTWSQRDWRPFPSLALVQGLLVSLTSL